MKKQSLVFGAFLLAFGGVIAKIIGALYKIPLTNILGSVGIGVYYLIFPIYSLLLVISSSGISIAVSNMVASSRIKYHGCDDRRILVVGVLYALFLSIICSSVMILLSKNIAITQGNENAYLGYIGIAPAIVFASIIAVFRGYFQGIQNMIPTAFSNIFEQIIKLCFGLLFSSLFVGKGVELAVFGAVLGVTISEFLAFIIMWINYLVYKNKLKYVSDIAIGESFRDIFLSITKYMIPATFSSIVIPFSAFLDSFMLINLLTNNFSSAVSTSLYGISNGVVGTLISVPVMLTLSIATVIVPNISGVIDREELNKKCSFAIKLAWIISLPVFVVFLLYAPECIGLLYRYGLSNSVIDEFSYAYKLLMLSSVNVIYLGFVYIFTAILQGVGKPMVPMIAMGIGFIFRTIIEIVLVPNMNVNIFGVVIANIAFSIVTSVIEIAILRKYIDISIAKRNILYAPLSSVIIMSGIMILLKSILPFSGIVNFIIAGIVGAIVYLISIFALGAFTKKEKSMLPIFKKLRFRKKTNT